MKRPRSGWLPALLAALTLCFAAPAAAQDPCAGPRQAHPPVAQDKAMKQLLHYPGVKAVKDNTVYLVDGSTLPFDDKQPKSFDQKLENADIHDHFAQSYPALAAICPPALNDDPGRFRCDALLKKLYGHDQAAIEANLVEVDWLPSHGGKKILFNKRQNAAAQLKKVSDELDKLAGEPIKYLKNIDSTYQYRPIQGTTRLSPHSYGIAIDLETKYTVYWLWDKEYNYRNEIPKVIVDAFERHGFVWGGRWYHYDTMHFEYRPELFPRVE